MATMATAKIEASALPELPSVREARALYVKALVTSVLGPANYTDAAIVAATTPSKRVAATPGKAPFTVAAVRALVGIDAIRAIGLK